MSPFFGYMACWAFRISVSPKYPIAGVMWFCELCGRRSLYARKLSDLRIPPANRLEPLKGNRKGQYSIRINDQWRVCFVWVDGSADRVKVADYH